MRSGKLSDSSRLHTESIEDVSAAPERLLTASSDKTAVVSTASRQIRLLGHEAEIRSCALSFEGLDAITGSKDGTARCWDVETGAQLCVLRPHRGEVTRVVALPQPGRVATTSDRRVDWWETCSCDELAVLDVHASALAFAPFDDRVLTGDERGTIQIWDASRNRMLASWKPLPAAVERFTFSDDGSKLLASLPSRALLFEWPSGKRLRAFAGPHAVLSPSGELVAVASDRCTAILFDAATGKRAGTVSDEQLDNAEDDESEPAAIAFSPDGSDIVTAGPDRIAAVSDVSGETRYVLEYGMEKAAWSPDGGCLAVVRGKAVHLLADPPEGETVILNGHDEGVTGIAYSRDGTRVLTSSYDATVRMWDARSGDLLRVIRATRDPVDCAVFSSDAKLIAAAIGGTVRIWRNLDLDEWRTLARQRVFRDLTDEERAQYGLPSQPSART